MYLRIGHFARFMFIGSKALYRKITRFPHWLYWRRIWVTNYKRAAIRFVRNYTVAAQRIAGNYLLLYLRIVKLNATALIRILRFKLSRLTGSQSVSSDTYVPKLPESLDSVTKISHWSHGDLLHFLKQRFSRQKLADSENKWINISSSKPIHIHAERVVSANLVLHVHYLEIAFEMLDYLLQTKILFRNVVITCTDDALRPVLERAAWKLAYDRVEVITVENSYRDARPFLIALQHLRDNHPILKIHTKKSPHLSEFEGIAWRQSLLKGLVPDASHVERFITWLRSENIPMVICPQEWLSERKHWGHNDLYVYSICRDLGITMARKAPFPMGTMFWANKQLVDELQKLPLPGVQDIREAHWADSTWAHGFERAIGQIIANSGKGIALTKEPNSELSVQ
jgi:lipopolysaccharide biosynthesis protein